MRKTNVTCLTALALGCATMIAGADTATKAGVLDTVTGAVQITRSGQEQTASTGSEVVSGDSIRTGDSSSTRLHTADNAVFELGGGTDFQIKNYSYTGTGQLGEARAPGTAQYEISRGALRTVTGSISKQRGDNYMVSAPEADIRVHGTDFSLQVGNGLLVIDYAGSVSVSNDTGQIELSSGQYVFVSSRHFPLHWKPIDQIKFESNIPIIIRLPPIPVPISPS